MPLEPRTSTTPYYLLTYDLMGPSETSVQPFPLLESSIEMTARQVRRVLDRRLTSIGFNLTQALILQYVVSEGALTQTSLATLLGLGKAATGTAIDALELRDMVERVPDPDDRRVWLVTARPEAKRYSVLIDEVVREFGLELRTGISRAERQALGATLNQMRSNLDAMESAQRSANLDNGSNGVAPRSTSRSSDPAAGSENGRT